MTAKEKAEDIYQKMIRILTKSKYGMFDPYARDRIIPLLISQLEPPVMPKIAEIEKTADELSCEHITDKFGDPHEHWCYPNIYQAILFTLHKLNESNFTAYLK